MDGGEMGEEPQSEHQHQHEHEHDPVPTHHSLFLFHFFSIGWTWTRMRRGCWLGWELRRIGIRAFETPKIRILDYLRLYVPIYVYRYMY
jgi:hypothetical protein